MPGGGSRGDDGGTRTAVNGNGNGNYNTTWRLPPAAPPLLLMVLLLMAMPHPLSSYSNQAADEPPSPRGVWVPGRPKGASHDRASASASANTSARDVGRAKRRLRHGHCHLVTSTQDLELAAAGLPPVPPSPVEQDKPFTWHSQVAWVCAVPYFALRGLIWERP